MFLINEAQGLLTRLEQLQPFATSMPMVTAAAIPYVAQMEIHKLILAGKKKLGDRVRGFIRKMRTTERIPIEKSQAAFSVLKLQFNSLLDQFDIFADVISQRSEHGTGVWVAGLDVLAKDALNVKGNVIDAPPLICYLDRGHGAAIRRARTRLPGGDENPVGVIQIPRERMVASGIGSSLIHEVGHQGSALLDLIASIRPALDDMAQRDQQYNASWKLLSRWISEILSDFWAVSFLGISATTGLMGVVSLPKYFIFRIVGDDPHPFPYIRVKISLAFGKVLYPEDQWSRLEKLWETMYPKTDLKPAQLQRISNLEAILPQFAKLVAEHRPQKLKGKMLRDIFPVIRRQPHQLRAYFRQWENKPGLMAVQRPSLVFAVVGQARADNIITTFSENRLLSKMLKHWALVNI
jgi:hypothetical protein